MFDYIASEVTICHICKGYSEIAGAIETIYPAFVVPGLSFCVNWNFVSIFVHLSYIKAEGIPVVVMIVVLAPDCRDIIAATKSEILSGVQLDVACDMVLLELWANILNKLLARFNFFYRCRFDPCVFITAVALNVARILIINGAC